MEVLPFACLASVSDVALGASGSGEHSERDPQHGQSGDSGNYKINRHDQQNSL
jgi:hypothetical protein